MADGWLRVNEREDAINCLLHCATTSDNLLSTPLDWKWCILSMHNALQATLACTLSGSAGIGALTEKSAAQWLEWNEKSRADPNIRPPKERMDDLIALYKKSKNHPSMRRFIGAEPITTSPQVDSDIKKLNELRRNFAHFTPKVWSIELLGLPRIICSATDVIEKLMQHPANTLGDTVQHSRSISKLLILVRKNMRNLEKHYSNN